MPEKRFSKGEAIRFGWQTMKDNLGFFLILSLVLFSIEWLPAIMVEMLKKNMPIVALLINFVGSFLGILITPGALKIFLKYCDGEKARLEDLLAYSHLFFRYLGAGLLTGLAFVAGLICLIIPGIILILKLQFFGYFMVDKNTGAIDSIKSSYKMTAGLSWELFLFALLLVLINIAGALCLLIGLLATMPVTALAMAYVYRKLTRENSSGAASLTII